jgi:hypothetical protein
MTTVVAGWALANSLVTIRPVLALIGISLVFGLEAIYLNRL